MDILAEFTKVLEKEGPEVARVKMDAALKEILRNDPVKGREILRVLAAPERARLARERFDIVGYGNHFWCLFGWDLPPHAVEWAEQFFVEWNEDKRIKGLMIEGFRGSSKSTHVVALALFITAHFPHRSGMNIQKTEDDARVMSKFMADIVEMNAGWKMMYPNVVPDKDRGWSVEGYHVKNTGIEYGEWIQKVMADHGRDPSFLAVSVTSGAVGKHPSGWLLFDDIHDYKNTSSKADMTRVVNTVTSDVLPTLMRPGNQPFVLWAYTPWDEEDAYSFVRRSGIFRHIHTPAWKECEGGDVEWEGKKGKLAWPTVMGLEELTMWRRTLGVSEFSRMILCDLTKAGVTLFKYYAYPREKIDPRWAAAGGVDYASVIMPTRQVEGNRSHFAEAIVRKTPMNTLVVCDGYVAQITQSEAEAHVMGVQETNRQLGIWKTTVIESNGKGEEFIALVRRNPGFTVMPHSVGVKNKPARLYEMAPWMENGIVTVSDADTPFLNTFRRFLERYPNLDKHDKEWDVADAVYHALFAFPECLIIPKGDQEMLAEAKRKVRKSNPWAKTGGNWSGYA